MVEKREIKVKRDLETAKREEKDRQDAKKKNVSPSWPKHTKPKKKN